MASTTTSNGSRSKARTARTPARGNGATAASPRTSKPKPKAMTFEAYDALPSAIMIVEPDLTIAHLNAAAVALLEEAEADLRLTRPAFRASDVVGQSVEQFYLSEARRPRSADELPARSQLDAGSHRFDLLASPIADESGRAAAFAVEWRDETELDELRRLLAVIDRSQAVIEFTPDGLVLGANDNFRQAMGYATDEIVGHHHRMFLDPAEAASPEYAQFWPNLARGQYVSGDFLRIDKAGRAVWLRASYNPITDRNGTTVKVVKYATAITEEKLQQEDLTGQMTAIHRAQAVIEFTPDGVVLGANENFRHTMGYGPDEIVGQHHRMFVDPAEAASPEYAQFWPNLARGQYVSGDFLRIDKSGRRVWLRASYNPIADRHGKTVKVVKYATDISEERQHQDNMQRLVAEASQVMASVADGDLTMQIESEYTGHLAQLSDATNTTIRTLNQLVAQIRGTAVSISNSAVEVAEANQDLSRRTEAQASSLEETASSMEEMTATVQQNADNARTASQLAVGAREQAESGGQVVDRAVEAVRAISDSSKKIADIIGVIDEIAFQTNLLALNAAVEAARAGDQGRGFAVVASEVRNLAQRSAGAAKEIKALIQDSLGKVEDGSNLVNQSGVGLAEIVGSVKKVSDIIGEIAAASVEQAAGINQVNQAVTSMDQGTQQNAAMVEEAAAASESLQQQAQGLLALTERFKVTWTEQHEAPVFAAPQPAAGPAAPAAPPAAQGRLYASARSNGRAAAADRGPARPSVAASRSDEAWQEF
ncbi:MAG: methyl-accepting chemotaxis protein [Acidimicrobiia bacterium]